MSSRVLLLCALVWPYVASAQDVLSAGAKAQQEELQTQSAEKEQQAVVQRVEEELQSRTAQYAVALYHSAKAAGIRMAPVEPAINEMNIGRRNSGVWDLTISEQLDGPYLVNVNDFGSVTPTFNVEGKGLYEVTGYLRDPQFEQTGKFSGDCKYQLYIGQQSKLYSCGPYLNGQLSQKIMQDLKEMFVASIKNQQ
jgi:hypothetical protein